MKLGKEMFGMESLAKFLEVNRKVVLIKVCFFMANLCKNCVVLFF